MAAKRKQIDLETKLEIINNANKLTPSELAIKYGLAVSTISTIVANKDKILEHFSQNNIKSNNKRMRCSNFPEIEDSLNMWFNNAITQPNITIDGPVMKAQALKYANLHGIHDFKASNGWLDAFRKRNNISYRNVIGESGLVDKTLVDNYRDVVLPSLIKDYESHNIFNADETALFYKAMPNKTLIYKNLPANHVKVNKERLSLLFCANMSGTEKLKPVVIGYFENPRCLKALNKANLPVIYRNNSRAWMTEYIFREWLVKIDHYFKSLDRKVLLFLDNFSGHCDENKVTKNKKPKQALNLTNIKLHYFPPNCTSVLQPMDQGIIQAFKMKYRRAIVEEKLQAIETESTMPEFNVLFAINKIHKCWKEISVSTIKHCFAKGGFRNSKTQHLSEVDEEAEFQIEKETFQTKLSKLSKMENFDFNIFQYVELDEKLPCYGELTDEEIVQAVQSQKNDGKIDEVNIEDSEDSCVPLISPSSAIEHLKALRLFLHQHRDDSSEYLKDLDKMEDFIERTRIYKQKTIESYFI